MSIIDKIKKISYKVLPNGMRDRILMPLYKSFLKTKYHAISTFFPSRAVLYCSCCGMKFPHFRENDYLKMTYYYNPERYRGRKQDIICPVCGSLPRHRILSSWLEKHREVLEGKVLYFAIEDGMKLWMNKNRINYSSADLFRSADLNINIENTGLDDDSWNCVICNHVLEHVDDYKRALRELYRILKPGGLLICSFPIDESLDTVVEDRAAIERFGQADHFRIFGNDSEEIIREAGFAVSRISGKDMSMSILPITGPADYDVNYLFLCKK